EHNCMRRINDCIIMLELEASCIPSRFSKIQLFLVALNAELEVVGSIFLNETLIYCQLCGI
ncbi:hypothetical protein Tco_0419980, partial [Tanacetum coccineum]